MRGERVRSSPARAECPAGAAAIGLTRPGILIAPIAVFLVGTLAIWLPPRPPMADLPQFAGQVALLRGLLTGSTPWAGALRIDALTPYLLGYVLVTPLALVLPVTAAVKTVLTAALAGFGLAAAAVRRELGAARALDAYALIGFFGFDYGWGFVTFLVAAPVALLLIWLSLRYARQPGFASGLAVLATGALLLFSHGLVFLFAVSVGLALTVARSGGLRPALKRALPFAALIAGGALLYLLAQHGALSDRRFALTFPPLYKRPLGLLEAVNDPPRVWSILALVALAVLPFVGGLALEFNGVERLLIAIAVLAAVALGPDTVSAAAVVYRRFGIFAPPAYAWLFSDRGASRSGLLAWAGPRLGLLAPALVALILAGHVVEWARFAREAAGFDTVLATARPGQRALSIIIDAGSGATLSRHAYLHFPLWYQVEKGGLVDPNFAAGPPSIVRYRNNPPGISADRLFAYHRDRFDWRRDDGNQWTYFFVRGPVPRALFEGADCPPDEVASSGAWTLFERRLCATVQVKTARRAFGPGKPPAGLTSLNH